MRVFTRNIYNGTISEWYELEHSGKNANNGYAGLDATAKVPRANTYSSLGGAGGISDLNTAYTAGVYSILSGATGSPAPSEYGQLMVHVSQGDLHNNTTNWIWQIFYSTLGGVWARRKVNEGAWAAWVPMWNGYNDSPIVMTRAAIANNTDFNNLTTNGIWSLYQAGGTITYVNSPNISFGILFVYKADTSTNYIKQEVIDVTNGNIYTRTKSTIWSAWRMSETTDKKNVANGYAGLDNNGFVSVNNLPYGGVVNLLGDSGRFMGTDGDPRSLQLTASFANNSFFSPYNGTTVASGGRFYHDNSTNGGTNGALTDEVISLIAALGLGG